MHGFLIKGSRHKAQGVRQKKINLAPYAFGLAPVVSLFLLQLLNECLNVGLGLLLGVTPQIAQVSVDGKHRYS